MADTVLDIERRLELAVIELLKAYSILTALITATRVVIRRDTSHAVDYPCATVQVIMAAEFGNRTGWYRCALQLSGMTYREDDKSRDTLKQIAGALRSWGQQTDLLAQIDATASALATATKLNVRDAWLEGGSFDASEDKVQEIVITLAVMARCSQATTT